MPTMGMTATEVWRAWKEPGGVDIRACFSGQVVGFSSFSPSIEYAFSGTGELERCWRTKNGIAVCQPATEEEMDEIFKEIEAGTFQIMYASASGVDSSNARYGRARQMVILHQSDGRPLEKHREAMGL